MEQHHAGLTMEVLCPHPIYEMITLFHLKHVKSISIII